MTAFIPYESPARTLPTDRSVSSTLAYRRIVTPMSPFGAWPTEHEPTNPDATPDFDEWGPDEYWKIDDWVTWHKAMKAAYGLDAANRTFIEQWFKQTNFANPIDARSTNSSFRDYARANGFLDALFGGLSFLKVLGAATDVVSSGSDVVSDVASGTKSIGTAAKYLLPVAAIAFALLYFKAYTPSRK